MRRRDAEVLLHGIHDELPGVLAHAENKLGTENGWEIAIADEALGPHRFDDFYAGARWLDAQMKAVS